MRPSRRTFLKVGLAGGAVLAGLGAWYGIEQRDDPARPGALGRHEREILIAVAGAILDHALPVEAQPRAVELVRTVDGVGVAIAGLSAAAQEELAELFSLLRFPLTRVALAGVWRPWQDADVDEVAAFLSRWRGSSVGLLQSAYAALHDLVTGVWYGQPQNWPALDYPGPPDLGGH